MNLSSGMYDTEFSPLQGKVGEAEIRNELFDEVQSEALSECTVLANSSSNLNIANRMYYQM